MNPLIVPEPYYTANRDEKNERHKRQKLFVGCARWRRRSEIGSLKHPTLHTRWGGKDDASRQICPCPSYRYNFRLLFIGAQDYFAKSLERISANIYVNSSMYGTGVHKRIFIACLRNAKSSFLDCYVIASLLKDYWCCDVVFRIKRNCFPLSDRRKETASEANADCATDVLRPTIGSRERGIL